MPTELRVQKTGDCGFQVVNEKDEIAFTVQFATEGDEKVEQWVRVRAVEAAVVVLCEYWATEPVPRPWVGV